MMFHMKRPIWLFLSISVSVCALCLFLFIGSAPAAHGDEPSWREPNTLLPYAEYPQLAVSPRDQSVTYVVGSPAYGIVRGNEFETWNYGSYTKIGDGGQEATSVYDKDGTQHIVWAQRVGNNSAKPYTVRYSRILPSLSQISQPRDLTDEIVGKTQYSMRPTMAYSQQTNTLWLAFELIDDDPNQDPFVAVQQVLVSKSTDNGSTWSAAEKVAKVVGYSPAQARIMTDANGTPHLFYGQQTDTESRAFIYTKTYTNGAWSAATEISGANRSRAFLLSTASAANGDVWVAWLSDPQSGIDSQKEVAVARLNGATGGWQHWNNLSGGKGKGAPAIAVSETGAVWVIWSGNDPDFTHLEYTLTTDNGATWRATKRIVNGRDVNIAKIGTSSVYAGGTGIAAIAARGSIYVVFGGLQTNPAKITDRTLFETQVTSSDTNPPDPTANPNPTQFPIPTDTPSTVAPGEPTLTPTATRSTSPTPTSGTATPTVTGTPTVTPTDIPMSCRDRQGIDRTDQYESDDNTSEAQAANRFIQSGATEQHTLCKEGKPNFTDIDTVLIAAQVGQTYSLLVTAQSFFPEMSVGIVGQPQIGKWNECNGDPTRLCVSFTATTTGKYYARISDAQNGTGNPGHRYDLSLIVGATPTPAPTATPRPTIPTPTIPNGGMQPSGGSGSFVSPPQQNTNGGSASNGSGSTGNNTGSGNTGAAPATATGAPTNTTSTPGSTPDVTAPPLGVPDSQAYGGAPQLANVPNIVATTGSPTTSPQTTLAVTVEATTTVSPAVSLTPQGTLSGSGTPSATPQVLPQVEPQHSIPPHSIPTEVIGLAVLAVGAGAWGGLNLFSRVRRLQPL